MTGQASRCIVLVMSNPSRPAEVMRLAGLRLVAARCALGLTQSELAQALGVTPQRLSNWERGEHLADVLAMRTLRRLYGVRLDWIYDGDVTSLPYELAVELVRRRPDLVLGATGTELPSADWDQVAAERRRA